MTHGRLGEEPLTGSPQTRQRHSALMEELLEKMEALQLAINGSITVLE